MDINIGMDGDIVIINMTGDLVAESADDVKAQVEKLTNKNFNYLLFNMDGVNFMDSSGLGACIAAHKALIEKKGMLVCAEITESVRKVFRITRADQKLNISPSKKIGLQMLQDRMISDRRNR